MKHLKKIFITVTLAASTTLFADVQLTNKVLVIGIDGVRTDTLLYANTPNIDSLWRGNSGAYRFDVKTDDVTWSGPCWTTMLTGVGSAKHGVTGNTVSGDHFAGYNTQYASFLDRLEAANPSLQTAAISQWDEVNTIFTNIDYEAVDTPSGSGGASIRDQAVALLAGQNVTVNNPDAIFLHFDEVDSAGHNYGYLSQQAVTAIENVDSYIGDILAALQNRDTYDEENWLILISTDHGGNSKSHGGTTPQEKYVWLVMNGMDVVTGEMEAGLSTADIAATAMAHLGLEIDPAWDLDGQVRGLKEDRAVVQINTDAVMTLSASGVAPIPEPSTYGLVFGGLAAITAVFFRRRKK